MLKDKKKILDVFRWLYNFGYKYEDRVMMRDVKFSLLIKDQDYARVNFIRNYAYARANAPLSYKINALKTLEHIKRHPKSDPAEYYKSLVAKPLPQSNPFLDPEFVNIDFCGIARLISIGKTYDAFEKLKLKGVGSKIKSLYIRDLVYLSGSEKRLKDNPSLIFTQPIDIWIKLFIDEVYWPKIFIDKKNESFRALAHHYTDRWNDLNRGLKIIEICKNAGVSPILVNQAIWIFSSRVVADTRHLISMVNKGNVKDFENERLLIGDYLRLSL